MQNNINNNDLDAFSDVFRQKLENHETPVDKTSWNEIEARLKSKKKRIIPFWFWLSGGAAVAALALLFMLQPLTETKETIAKTTNPNIQQVTGQRVSIRNIQQPKQVQPKITTFKQIASINRLPGIHQTQSYAVDLPNIKTLPVDSPERNSTNEIISGDNQRDMNETVQHTTVNNDTVMKKSHFSPNSLVEEKPTEPVARKKNKGGWLLAASIGSNGSVQSGSGNYELAVANDNIVNASTSFTSIMTPADFSDINYTPPLSVGLIVRKDLNKSLSIESGLVYTYLLTTYINNGVQRKEARLHLHYIGVPLNLITRVWENPKWEVYISGGGMIEKGIKSIYDQKQYTGNQIITTTVITDINGIQWSVNGAIGTTYKIKRNIGLFFEPKIAYYFENNQPLSFRTEHPVSLGLTAGVRFQIK